LRTRPLLVLHALWVKGSASLPNELLLVRLLLTPCAWQRRHRQQHWLSPQPRPSLAGKSGMAERSLGCKQGKRATVFRDEAPVKRTDRLLQAKQRVSFFQN